MSWSTVLTDKSHNWHFLKPEVIGDAASWTAIQHNEQWSNKKEEQQFSGEEEQWYNGEEEQQYSEVNSNPTIQQSSNPAI